MSKFGQHPGEILFPSNCTRFGPQFDRISTKLGCQNLVENLIDQILTWLRCRHLVEIRSEIFHGLCELEMEVEIWLKCWSNRFRSNFEVKIQLKIFSNYSLKIDIMWSKSDQKYSAHFCQISITVWPNSDITSKSCQKLDWSDFDPILTLT